MGKLDSKIGRSNIRGFDNVSNHYEHADRKL